MKIYLISLLCLTACSMVDKGTVLQKIHQESNQKGNSECRIDTDGLPVVKSFLDSKIDQPKSITWFWRVQNGNEEILIGTGGGQVFAKYNETYFSTKPGALTQFDAMWRYCHAEPQPQKTRDLVE